MTDKLMYHRNAARPIAKVWWRDDALALIDFSSGYTFTFRIGNASVPALLEKTSGITGAAGSGTSPSGTPNVTITWSAGDLDIEPGTYGWQLEATTGGLPRDPLTGIFQILDVIEAATP